MKNVKASALNVATAKPEEKNSKPEARPVKKPDGNKGTLEHRLDYVVNFLMIKKDDCKTQNELHFCLDDICRMDFIVHFVNIQELVLIN